MTRQAGPRAVARRGPAGAAPRGRGLRPRAAEARRHRASTSPTRWRRTPPTRCSSRLDEAARATLVAVAERRRAPLRHPAARARATRRSSRYDRVRAPLRPGRAAGGRLGARVARRDARRRSGRSRCRRRSRAVVPTPAASAIAEACAADALRLGAAARRRGGGSATPVEPLVRALVEQVGEERRAAGCTSARRARTSWTPRRCSSPAGRSGSCSTSSTASRRRCARLARSHRDTPMAGRTLLQQAVPTTFGLKAAGWLVGLLDARARLARAAPATGSRRSSAAPPERSRRSASTARRSRASSRVELGLAEPTLPWHTNRVRIAELGAALEIAAGSCWRRSASTSCCSRRPRSARCARAGRAGGSSAMPQKRNPVGADEGARLRRARPRPRVGAHGRARPGARARGRRLAGRVGGALRARSRTPGAPRPRWRARSRGSRSTRRGCGRTSTSPADRSVAERIALVLTDAARPHRGARARARRVAARRARPGGRWPRSSPASTRA